MRIMEDAKRIRIAGTAIPVRGHDIDTDRIIPARYLRCVTFDALGGHAFEDDRAQLKERGKTHAFDDPRFADGEILFVNKNFGCGSSREHAPQAIMRWGKGIKAVVGESFAEIFRGNCTALGVPAVTVSEEAIAQLMTRTESEPDTEFVLDLETKSITGGGLSLPIELDEGVRRMFLEGRWDSTTELLAAGEAIDRTAASLPYVSNWR